MSTPTRPGTRPGTTNTASPPWRDITPTATGTPQRGTDRLHPERRADVHHLPRDLTPRAGRPPGDRRATGASQAVAVLEVRLEVAHEPRGRRPAPAPGRSSSPSRSWSTTTGVPRREAVTASRTAVQGARSTPTPRPGGRGSRPGQVATGSRRRGTWRQVATSTPARARRPMRPRATSRVSTRSSTARTSSAPTNWAARAGASR